DGACLAHRQQRRHPLALVEQLAHLVGAIELLADAARLHGIGEPRRVTARLPHLRVADDRAVEPDDLDRLPVGSGGRLEHHRRPPRITEILLELGTQRAVVPEALYAAVDLGRLEYEPPALSEPDQALHPPR